MAQGKYYILDCGGKMTREAEHLLELLRKNKSHVVKYLTNCPELLCLQEISEDEFLEHYRFNPQQDEND